MAGSGASVILMASRALGRRRDRRRRTTSTSTAPCWTSWTARSSCTGWARCSTRRWPATGAATTSPLPRTTFLELVEAHPGKVDGVKVSLLDAAHEIALRARLATLTPRVRLYTGDDFHYPELIHGDGTHHSDALLGVFAAIDPLASTALQAYDAGDADRGHALLASTQELGRHLFSAPTPHYKTGHRLPGLAQRSAAGLRHGRRAAGGPLTPPPGADLPARRRGRACCATPSWRRTRVRQLLAVHGLAGLTVAGAADRGWRGSP